MGVSGCGKSTIGKLLAKKLDIPFFDADDYHMPSNIIKMASGKPLVDEDRWPWLELLSMEIKKWQQEKGAVLACSALKEVYRERLFGFNNSEDSGGSDNEAFAKAKNNIVYLKGDFENIEKRLQTRKSHFFDPKLLQSQFDTLEEPSYGIHIDASAPIKSIIPQILKISNTQ